MGGYIRERAAGYRRKDGDFLNDSPLDYILPSAIAHLSFNTCWIPITVLDVIRFKKYRENIPLAPWSLPSKGLFFIRIISDMFSSFVMCKGKGKYRKWSSWSVSVQYGLFGISKC